jgi:hypothetical protein
VVLFDAVAKWLARLAAVRPAVVVLEDLHWADQSSLELLDFVSRSLHNARLLIVGTHRPDELDPAARVLLTGVATRNDHITLAGLTASEVRSLVANVAGEDFASTRSDAIHRRTGGHPFFVRELASVGEAAGADTTAVPTVVQDAITRRLDRADDSTHAVLRAAAVIGNELDPDVLAGVLEISTDETARAIDTAAAIDVVVRGERNGYPRFVHDLFRETLYDQLSPAQRADLHRRVGVFLAGRAERGKDVPPAELARHFAAAVAIDGPDRALHWAFAAATAECAGLAFYEAAAHLARVRSALTDAGVSVSDETLTDLLVAEADALGRAGDPEAARRLLAQARGHARRCSDGARLGSVALGVQRLGSRFAMPRPEVVGILAEARDKNVADRLMAARLTAAMARELHHSVAQDRPRAARLSEDALERARTIEDPATLAVCLLARHDVLWTPGSAAERRDLAEEIIALAAEGGDEEQRVEGLLLLANALLERGSPGFRPALDAYLTAIDGLGQRRHQYLATTRRGALALLDGRLDEAAELIEVAATLGERIREPDTGNVRMSQLLELTRARGDPEEQVTFAREAVAWWVGAPGFAHAVAAGFLARAGDVEGARHHVETVAALGSWGVERSSLWSVFEGNLTDAAVALEDEAMCGDILDELRPISGTCGVNGAVVAFSGSHAHYAGLAAAALGRTDEATALLQEAVAVHDRLGAATWRATSLEALSAVGVPRAAMRRCSGVWDITFRSEAAKVPDSKGLRDIATLLRRPGVDVHVLELAGSLVDSGTAIEMVDRTALARYRQHLSALDEDIAEAERNCDPERLARAEAEREALIGELRAVSGLGGSARFTGAHAGERARKAVSARIKDAIQHLDGPMPLLAEHLRQAVVTGAWCRYRADLADDWIVER